MPTTKEERFNQAAFRDLMTLSRKLKPVTWSVGVTLAWYKIDTLQELLDNYDGYLEPEDVFAALDELLAIGSLPIAVIVPSDYLSH